MDRTSPAIPQGPRAWLSGLLVFVLTTGNGTALAFTPGDATEAQLKAAFIFNFAKYVEWSPTAFPGATSPLVICILGEDPIDDALVETIGGKTIGGRSIVVTRSSRTELPKACHILFISRSAAKRLDEILSRVDGKHTLTVSDIARFARRGGIIGLTRNNRRIRLDR